MGATVLRDDESEFIEGLRISAEIRKINDGSHGSMTRASRRVEELYRKEFSGLLRGETDEEFLARRRLNKKAKRLSQETEAEREARLAKIGERILGIFKRHSSNFTRRKKSDPVATSSPQTTPPAPLAAISNPYREFQQSQHPSKPKMSVDASTPREVVMRKFNQDMKLAFDSLPPEDLAQFTAQAKAKRTMYEGAEQRELRRAKHAEEMHDRVERATQNWQRQSGWVGMCMLGGLDQHGELVGTYPATGKDRYGLTFEERLAREFGTSVTYIRLTFSKWLGDIFDAPVPPTQDLGLSAQEQRSRKSGELVQSDKSLQSQLGTPGLAPTQHDGSLPMTPRECDVPPPATPALATETQLPMSASRVTPGMSGRMDAQPTTAADDVLDTSGAPQRPEAVQSTAAKEQVLSRAVVIEDSDDEDDEQRFPGTVVGVQASLLRTRATLVPPLVPTLVPSSVTPLTHAGAPRRNAAASLQSPEPELSPKTHNTTTEAQARVAHVAHAEEVADGAAPLQATITQLATTGAKNKRQKNSKPQRTSTVQSRSSQVNAGTTGNTESSKRRASTGEGRTQSTTTRTKQAGKKPSAKDKTVRTVAASAEVPPLSEAPHVSRTGRVQRKTARAEGVSPDMSAVKHLLKGSQGGKRNRADVASGEDRLPPPKKRK